MKISGLTSLGAFLIVAIIVGTIWSAWRDNTNHSYLRGLIDGGWMEKTAAALISNWKTADTEPRATTEAGWIDLQNRLAGCLRAEAEHFLLSDDPYLVQRANKASGGVLAERFMKACGAV